VTATGTAASKRLAPKLVARESKSLLIGERADAALSDAILAIAQRSLA
jgi:hypothetical protein